MTKPALPTTRFGPLATGDLATPRDRSYWVVDDRLIAGAYPFRGSRTEGVALLTKLTAAGVTTFLDLTEAGSDAVSDGHLAMYDGHLEELDAALVRYPYRDMDVPTEAMMTEILDAIDGLLDREEVVYLHCWGGLGRTGTVVACWLLRHGAADHDDVFDVLTELRTRDVGAGHRLSPQTSAQRDFVLKWAEGR